MSESDPQLELRIRGEQFFATRENTTLFTFFGSLAMFNHVFLELGEQDEHTALGAYVFCDHPAYEQIGNFVAEHNFPMVLNRNEVPPCDEDAWTNAHPIEDFVPEEWGNGTEQS